MVVAFLGAFSLLSRPASGARATTGVRRLRQRYRLTNWSLASLGHFLQRFQCDLGSPVLHQKIFPFPSDPNHFYIARIPAHTKGAFRDRHERRVGMRWTRG